MEGLLIPTNLLLNTPLTAGVTFEISKNPITVKGSGYPHITEIHVVAWTILVPEKCPGNGNAYPIVYISVCHYVLVTVALIVV